jgi:hypothetical protein
VRTLVGVCVVALLLLGSPVFGQTFSGTVSGRVVDAAGASVPGAAVTLNPAGYRRDPLFASDAAGEFVFAAIQPGIMQFALRVTF